MKKNKVINWHQCGRFDYFQKDCRTKLENNNEKFGGATNDTFRQGGVQGVHQYQYQHQRGRGIGYQRGKGRGRN